MKQITVAILFLGQLALGQTVINGDRIITGSWDASDARWTKPAKTGTTLPATCSVSEVFFKADATAGRNLFACTAANTWTQVAGYTGTKSLTLFDPAAGDTGRVQIMLPKDATITRVACSVKAATSVSINLDKRSATTPDTAGTNALSAALVCGTNQRTTCSSGCDVNTISSGGVTARAPLALTISNVTGTPDTLRVYVEYTEN